MDELPKERWEVMMSLLAGYSKCRDYIMLTLNKHNVHEDKFLSNIYNILKFISERNITVTILAQNNLLWDGQIILRTVLEASMKLFHLCNCPETERNDRLNQYLNDLDEIHSMKQSEIAKKIVLANEGNSESSIFFSPMILSTEKEEMLKQKWPRQKRKALEQKWSFSEILMAQSQFFGEKKELLFSLFHPYKLSSHLIHADETGIGIIAERASRSAEEKHKIELYHFCCIMSWSYHYLHLCGMTVGALLKEDIKPLADIYSELEPIHAQIELYGKAVTADPDYDKFR